MISGVIAHFSRYAARFQLESICFLAQNTGGLPPWLIRGPNHIVKVNFNKPDVSDGRRPSAGCIAAAQLWNQACPGRVHKPSMRSLTLLILAAAAGWSAEDANGIIKRLAAAQTGNDSLAGEYTYVQEAAFFTYDKAGHANKDRSETHDIMFVEGISYHKLTARNGKPLERGEAAKEEKKLQETAEERRKQRHAGLFHPSLNTASEEDLLALFDNRLVGEEEIRGRKAWVIESTPRPGHQPANDHEKQVLSFQKKLWIDEAETVLVKTLDVVIGNQVFMKPGSMMAWEFSKIDGGAWLPVTGVIDAHLQFAKFIKPYVRTEYANSQFQKFDVKSTITMDPPK